MLFVLFSCFSRFHFCTPPPHFIVTFFTPVNFSLFILFFYPLFSQYCHLFLSVSYSPFFPSFSCFPSYLNRLSVMFSYFLNLMIDYVNSKLIKYVVAISTSNYELIGKKILEDVFTHNKYMLIRWYEAWLSERRFIINVWMNIENLNIYIHFKTSFQVLWHKSK